MTYSFNQSFTQNLSDLDIFYFGSDDLQIVKNTISGLLASNPSATQKDVLQLLYNVCLGS